MVTQTRNVHVNLYFFLRCLKLYFKSWRIILYVDTTNMYKLKKDTNACMHIYMSYNKIKPHKIKLGLGDCIDCNLK